MNSPVTLFKSFSYFTCILAILILPYSSYAVRPPSPEELQELEKNGISLSVWEDYQTVFSDSFPIKQIIDNAKRGISLRNVFNVNTATGEVGLNTRYLKIFSNETAEVGPTEQRPPMDGWGFDLGRGDAKPDLKKHIPLIKNLFQDNPSSLQELNSLYYTFPDMKLSEMLSFYNEVKSIRPDWIFSGAHNSIHKFEYTDQQSPQLDRRREIYLKLIKKTLTEDELMQVLDQNQLGPLQSYVLMEYGRTPLREGILKMIQQQDLLNSKNPESALRAAQLMAAWTNLKDIDDDRTLQKIGQIFVEGQLLAQDDIDFSRNAMGEIIRMIKKSSLADFPTSVIYPLITSFFRTYARFCPTEKEQMPELLPALSLSDQLFPSAFAQHLAEFEKFLEQDILFKDGTTINLNHVMGDLSFNSVGQILDNWDTGFLDDLTQKMGTKLQTFRGHNFQTSQKSMEQALQAVAETKGPLTFFVRGHGYKSDGAICIHQKNVKVTMEQIAEAIKKKKTNDPSAPIVLFLNSCYSHHLGKLVMENWQKDPQLRDLTPPLIISTAYTQVQQGQEYPREGSKAAKTVLNSLVHEKDLHQFKGRDLVKHLYGNSFLIHEYQKSNQISIMQLGPCQEWKRCSRPEGHIKEL